MKKLTLVVIALAVLGSAATAQTLESFKAAFQTFSDDMVQVLSVNSTTGNVWSSAYVGGFPKFGVGLAVGANLIPSDSVAPLFTAANETMPSEIQEYGLPIPAAAASFKIGIPFLKMDVGVKAGLIPEFASGALSGMGVEADYQTLGVNVRYALLKDRLLIPALSIGASWNYVKGAAKTSLGMDQSFSYTVNSTGDPYYDGLYEISVIDPDMDLEWQANTFDFTIQISKNLLIFTPYAGAGYTIGIATVKGGMAASPTVTVDGSAAQPDQIAALEQAAGVSIDDQGFLVTSESTAPVFRVYGGTSINIFIVKIDLMASYVPASQSLGAQVMARVQL